MYGTTSTATAGRLGLDRPPATSGVDHDVDRAIRVLRKERGGLCGLVEQLGDDAGESVDRLSFELGCLHEQIPLSCSATRQV
jgi:hypothetical protein